MHSRMIKAVKLLTKQEEWESPPVTALRPSALCSGTTVSYSPNCKGEPRENTTRDSNHTQSGKGTCVASQPCGRGAADGRADRQTQDGPSGAGWRPQPMLTHRPPSSAGPCGTQGHTPPL